MLHQIKLHLARTRAAPEGSERTGYEIIAPLDQEGHLSAAAWREVRERCVVRRIRAGEPDRIGHLVHRPGGAGGATWVVDYDESRDDDDEAGYRLGSHLFRTGEYVSIRDEDGEMLTFRVAAVRPLPACAGIAA